jgi:hypothetical protein
MLTRNTLTRTTPGSLPKYRLAREVQPKDPRPGGRGRDEPGANGAAVEVKPRGTSDQSASVSNRSSYHEWRPDAA